MLWRDTIADAFWPHARSGRGAWAPVRKGHALADRLLLDNPPQPYLHAPTLTWHGVRQSNTWRERHIRLMDLSTYPDNYGGRGLSQPDALDRDLDRSAYAREWPDWFNRENNEG